MAAVKKLHYFDTNGLGEPIRYLLHYGGVKFEDVRYSKDDWPNHKEWAPYGMLPVYEDGHGRLLHQSIVIMKFLGHELGLVVGDSFEDARLEAIVHSMMDMFKKISEYYRETDPAKKEQMRIDFEKETVKFFVGKFEKELIQNGGYFAGKLTWADFALVGLIEAMDHFMNMEVEKDFPTVKALIKNIKNLPAIKAYIASRKPYSY